MTTRRRPRWSELRPYLRMQPPTRSFTDRRLAGAATIADLRRIARRHTPRAAFDYTDGAAESETSLRRARDAFGRVEFVPSVLRDVSRVDPSTTILGRTASLPIIFAPTGFTRFMNHEGEPAVARVAARSGIPYALSTLGTTSPEALAEAVPDVERWFQLYIWRDRDAEPRAHLSGRSRGLLGAGVDRRHARGGHAPARRPQRADHPADADGQDARETWRSIRVGGSTC